MTEPDLRDPDAAVRHLREAVTIRERCEQLFEAACANELRHFSLELSRLDTAAEWVLATIRERYPDWAAVPIHSRWRHFEIDGQDRWSALAATLHGLDRDEIARIRTELVIVSVLLDAGAGEHWRYRDASGPRVGRSEGLALASLDLYRAGHLSTQPLSAPLRVDAERLVTLDASTLHTAFQVREDNPLIGIEGRLALLQALGRTIEAQPALFGPSARLGALYDHWRSLADARPQDDPTHTTHSVTLSAPRLLRSLLDAFEGIWPGRLTIGAHNLGDVWHHELVRGSGLTDALVPFHKLSQWLSYSLLEPLDEAGLEITERDALTGLAEYRNGGLFVDTGVIVARDPLLASTPLTPDAEPIVEWRALTLVLLDRLVVRLRERLSLDAEQLPLATMLEGGTWAAGRRIAAQRRADGAAPFVLVSDGTVF